MSEEVWDEKHLVLLSIMYQLVDHGADLSELNPNVQDYIAGLCEEFNDAEEDDEKEYFEKLYYYADTYFNKLYGAKESLH